MRCYGIQCLGVDGAYGNRITAGRSYSCRRSYPDYGPATIWRLGEQRATARSAGRSTGMGQHRCRALRHRAPMPIQFAILVSDHDVQTILLIASQREMCSLMACYGLQNWQNAGREHRVGSANMTLSPNRHRRNGDILRRPSTIISSTGPVI